MLNHSGLQSKQGGNQIALIMRNKPDIDEIDIDDLYNNLRVYKDEMKKSSSSTSTSHNLAFLSSKNTSSAKNIDEDDLEELDLRWQVAMLTTYRRRKIAPLLGIVDLCKESREKIYVDNSSGADTPTNESSYTGTGAQYGREAMTGLMDFEVEPFNML
ncbi:hypothetical protein Tco_1304837 [Tanacetum coccineum]